jgi:hypothetical protein
MEMKVVKSCSRIFLMFWIVFIVGCATKFAPKYDEALFEGVTDTNVKIMELFALVSAGTNSSTCSARQSSYNSVIGSIDALALQSKARPVPENSITEKVNQYLESRGIGSMTGDAAPSASALEEVSKNLTKMKEVDCKSGLTNGVVATFKNAVIISMDQAITYESFLNR